MFDMKFSDEAAEFEERIERMTMDEVPGNLHVPFGYCPPSATADAQSSDAAWRRVIEDGMWMDSRAFLLSLRRDALGDADDADRCDVIAFDAEGQPRRRRVTRETRRKWRNAASRAGGAAKAVPSAAESRFGRAALSAAALSAAALSSKTAAAAPGEPPSTSGEIAAAYSIVETGDDVQSSSPSPSRGRSRAPSRGPSHATSRAPSRVSIAGSELANAESEFTSGDETDLEIEAPLNAPFSFETHYADACRDLGVVPASFFMRHMRDRSVSLRHHGFSTKGIDALCRALAINPFVHRLDLGENRLSELSLSILSGVVVDSVYLTSLSLSGNAVDAAGMRVLAAALADNRFLTEVDLSHNSLDDESRESLSSMLLANSTIENLDLSFNRLGAVAADAIGAAVADNAGLKGLKLSWNQIGARGAASLAAGVRASVSLKRLDVSWNGVRSKGAAAIFRQIVVHNPVVEEIKLRHNLIDWRAAEVIAKSLRKNETLRSLDLSDNPLEAIGVCHILRKMLDHPSSGLRKIVLPKTWNQEEIGILSNQLKNVLDDVEIKS